MVLTPVPGYAVGKGAGEAAAGQGSFRRPWSGSKVPGMYRSRRQRLRIALVVIACLLFQQVALAAYSCTLIQPAPAAMSGHCAEMGMAAQTPDNPALCAKHCAPDQTTAADHVKLSVPALMLPPLAFAGIRMTCATSVAAQADVDIARSDPPPRLRYCSLLI